MDAGANRQPDANSVVANLDAAKPTTGVSDARLEPLQDARVQQPVVPPFVYEPFMDTNRPLLGASGGVGWAAPWAVQNDSMELGCEVAGASLMLSGIKTEGGAVQGGCAYLTVSRRIDKSVSGPLSGHINGATGLLGKEGETLWVSFLVRKDQANDQSVYLGLGAQLFYPTSWSQGVALGYFGPEANEGSQRFWGLRIGSTYHKAKRLEVGNITLVVAAIKFGTPANVRVFVNPSVRNDGPSDPDVELTDVRSELSAEWIIAHIGDTPGNASVDELRIGTSFQSVVPQVP